MTDLVWRAAPNAWHQQLARIVDHRFSTFDELLRFARDAKQVDDNGGKIEKYLVSGHPGYQKYCELMILKKVYGIFVSTDFCSPQISSSCIFEVYGLFSDGFPGTRYVYQSCIGSISTFFTYHRKKDSLFTKTL